MFIVMKCCANIMNITRARQWKRNPIKAIG